jgi:predicted permease
LTQRDTRWLFVLGKLQPGVDVAAVRGHLETAAALMTRQWPDTHAGRGATFRLMSERNGELRGMAIGGAIGMGIIGLILLLACFNVANLLLARALERQRDMAIRAALGAGPARLMRLVVTEGLAIACLSGVLALLLAGWTQSLIGAFAMPIDVPQHIDFTPDRRVVGCIVSLIVIAGVLPGLWPAVAAARVNVSRVLAAQSVDSAGGRPSLLSRGLVAAQIAGSTAFLALAMLFVQSYVSRFGTDIGFARSIVVAEIDPASQAYTSDGTIRYVEAAMERAGAVPGVTAVALIDRAPFFIGFERETSVAATNTRCEGTGCPRVSTYMVSRRYFTTTGGQLVAGRDFAEGQAADEVIVNQPFADLFWPRGDGLGGTLRLGPDGRVATVVGIVGLARMRGLDRERPSLFLPIRPEHWQRGVSIVARTAVDPSSVVRPTSEAIAAIDPAVPVVSVKTMEQRMAVQLWPFRTLSAVFSICGVLALVLSVVGLAGVVMQTVSRRVREFGVRLSVGATPQDLAREVLTGGLRLLVPGLALGLLCAGGAARAAQSLFVGVNVLDPLLYLAVAVVQAAVVVIACLAPALRAARVDPLNALRSR